MDISLTQKTNMEQISINMDSHSNMEQQSFRKKQKVNEKVEQETLNLSLADEEEDKMDEVTAAAPISSNALRIDLEDINNKIKMSDVVVGIPVYWAESQRRAMIDDGILNNL